MDPAKKFKAMLTMQMGDVTALSISPDDGNQLAVLHLRCVTDSPIIPTRPFCPSCGGRFFYGFSCFRDPGGHQR